VNVTTKYAITGSKAGVSMCTAVNIILNSFIHI